MKLTYEVVIDKNVVAEKECSVDGTDLDISFNSSTDGRAGFIENVEDSMWDHALNKVIKLRFTKESLEVLKHYYKTGKIN